MSLEDTFKSLLAGIKLPEFPKDGGRQSALAVRDAFLKVSRSVERDAPSMAETKTLAIDGADGLLKARLYAPLGAGIPPGPGLVFFHGGGFTVGDLETYDVICKRLAAGSRCRVLSVAYRLAPEHKFPSAHDDALASWLWAVENAADLGMDPARMAVGGDSAGGNLSAFIAQEMVRTGGPKPAYQLLLYPLVQFMNIKDKKRPPQESGIFIADTIFDYFQKSYLPDGSEASDQRISPLFAGDESFKGLPPAHIVVCGWDPLHDEGLAYAAKLQAFGVRVTTRDHKGMVHGFMNMTAVSVPAREAIHDAGEMLGKALGAL